MAFNIGETVEISKNEEGIPGNYYEAGIMSIIEPNKYLVSYDTRSTQSGEFLTEVVDSDDIRPQFPTSLYVNKNFLETDRVEVLVDGVWRPGTITRRPYSFCQVKLDCKDDEARYNVDFVRPHLEWHNGEWLHPRPGHQAGASAQGDQPANVDNQAEDQPTNDDNQASTSAQGDQPANVDNQAEDQPTNDDKQAGTSAQGDQPADDNNQAGTTAQDTDDLESQPENESSTKRTRLV